ncbi:MAG: FAD-dependent oxidoreductase [Bulleidia sp.]
MKLKQWISAAAALSLLAGCGSSASSSASSAPAASSASAAVSGTFEGSADGRGGTINVSVTLEDGMITAINVGDNAETPGISDYPLEHIPAEIVRTQSLAVDNASGATLTSAGVRNAVADALSNAGLDPDAFRNTPYEAEVEPVSDINTQIVIVGGGMTGLMTAAAAGHEGADVVLLEKKPYTGGSLLIAGGGMVTVDSDTLPDDVDDSVERVLDYVRSVNETSTRQPDYDFLTKILEQTGATIDYGVNELGLDFTYTDTTYVRGYFGQGYEYAASLASIAEQEGVQIITNATATSIVMDGDRATGVTVTAPGGDFTVNADAVVIAAGGASCEPGKTAFVAPNEPTLSDITLFEEANAGNTGDGYQMLSGIGAEMGPGPYIKTAWPDFSPVFRFTWRNNPNVNNQLVVDAEGNRFANESPIYSTIFDREMINHGSSAYYVIYDGVNTDINPNEDTDFLTMMKDQVAAGEGARTVVHADTIAELAEKLDMDPDTLQAAYESYQAACESGEDSEYGKSADHLVPYDESDGFYAAYLMPASWGTYGGALTDDTMHVLKNDGTPFGNIYAGGESSTSLFFGDYYIGSFSLGLYSTQGRIIAQTAAAAVKGN